MTRNKPGVPMDILSVRARLQEYVDNIFIETCPTDEDLTVLLDDHARLMKEAR